MNTLAYDLIQWFRTLSALVVSAFNSPEGSLETFTDAIILEEPASSAIFCITAGFSKIVIENQPFNSEVEQTFCII